MDISEAISGRFHTGPFVGFMSAWRGDVQRAINMSRFDSVRVLHTVVSLPPSTIIWYRLMGGDVCGWEGNRRSSIALALRYKLQWFTHRQAQERKTLL